MISPLNVVPEKPGTWKGAILMEVVMALGILFLSAGVLLGGLSMSFRTVKRLKLETQAADLAVSVLSKIQMGQLGIASDGPNVYLDENLEGWTWEVVTEPVEQESLEDAEFTRIEIVIGNETADFKHRLAYLSPEKQVDMEEETLDEPEMEEE